MGIKCSNCDTIIEADVKPGEQLTCPVCSHTSVVEEPASTKDFQQQLIANLLEPDTVFTMARQTGKSRIVLNTLVQQIALLTGEKDLLIETLKELIEWADYVRTVALKANYKNEQRREAVDSAGELGVALDKARKLLEKIDAQ